MNKINEDLKYAFSKNINYDKLLSFKYISIIILTLSFFIIQNKCRIWLTDIIIDNSIKINDQFEFKALISMILTGIIFLFSMSFNRFIF